MTLTLNFKKYFLVSIRTLLHNMITKHFGNKIAYLSHVQQNYFLTLLINKFVLFKGLDPAGPLWVTSSNKISSRDAVYVEAIHTDGNTLTGLGIGSNVADADFYPNGGNNQPGCLLGLCDHNRAWELFASTVTRNHLVGRRCYTSVQISLNTCYGSQLRMGNNDMRKSG